MHPFTKEHKRHNGRANWLTRSLLIISCIASQM